MIVCPDRPHTGSLAALIHGIAVIPSFLHASHEDLEERLSIDVLHGSGTVAETIIHAGDVEVCFEAHAGELCTGCPNDDCNHNQENNDENDC